MNAPTGSTLIPALGMTFAEADSKACALFAEAEAIYATRDEAEEDTANALVVEASEIRFTLFTTPPRTPVDALAVLNWLAHAEYGLPNAMWVNGQESAAVLLRDFMATLAADPATPPQPPYPPKPLTPQSSLRGWLEAGAPIVWREHPGARSGGSRYTVLDCTIVGPFFVDVIRQDEPDTPEAPFLWSVCRLLENGFIVRGDETTLDAAKAAAEEAVREAMMGEPDEPPPTTTEASAPATHAAAVEAFNAGRWGAAFEAWADYSNDDRLEANIAVLAERFRLAMADAGPVIAIGDALALSGLQHELVESADTPDGWSLYGARACMVSVISEALGEMARRALHPASVAPGAPSVPPAASK